ncbi:hypothetical protein PIROE2DRAFT_5895, partial [Piromyces sp. E2]
MTLLMIVIKKNPSNDSSQSPDNYYDGTESSTSSADLDDLISDDDPMLLNIINMSINNYKKNELSTTSNTKENSSTTTTPSISKHNSATGISSMVNHKRNICFQQNPIIINSIEEECNHLESFSSENQTNSSHQLTDNSVTSSQSTLSQIDEEIISPETLARSATCKEYLEFRYNYINDLITNGKIYNPLFIMRWRSDMWIMQATQGHLNTLKKIGKINIFADFNSQYGKTNNTSENSTDENRTSLEQFLNSMSNIASGGHSINNTSSSNNNSEDNSVYKTDEFNISGERGHIKSSPTDTDISTLTKGKHNLIDQNSSSTKDYNKRESLPLMSDKRKALNEEFMSSYENIFKKINKEIKDNNKETDGSVLNKNLSNENNETAILPGLKHNSSVITNGTTPITCNSNKNESDNLINLFIPVKSQNHNKKPLLSIITNNLNMAANNNTGSKVGTHENYVPNSAPLLEVNNNILFNRPASKLSTEYHSDIGDELTIQTPQSSKFPSSNSRLLSPGSHFSEIPSVKRIDEHIINDNKDKDKEDNNIHLEVPIHDRGRRSSMPDISHGQNQSFTIVNKKSKEKIVPNIVIENSFGALNYNYNGSNSNMDTPTSSKNPLRKILLRKLGKQSEQQDSGDETPKYSSYDSNLTSSNIYINNKNNNSNNNLSESKNIKKLFNMDSKGIRSIIKDIQPKFQYDKRQSLAKSDMENSVSSFNYNDDTDSSTVKQNLEYSSTLPKKNSYDKKKKRNILNIKKIFERNNTSVSIKNKRNSELLFENESDDNNKRINEYVNSWVRNNGSFYNEDDLYSNIGVEESYSDRYNEIMEECTSPNLKFDFTNEEFLKKNPILFNTKIILTYKSPKEDKNNIDPNFTNEVELNNLLELEEKYKNLVNIIYKNLEENILESIRYNLIKANYCIYNFSKELQNMNNMEIFKSQEIKHIVNDLDLTNSKNEEIYQKGDAMEKDHLDKELSLSVDFVNETTTVINPEIRHRKSVINRMYNVKDRPFLFNEVDNTDNDGDNESIASSTLDSPITFDEPNKLLSVSTCIRFIIYIAYKEYIKLNSINKKNNKRLNVKMESIMEYDSKEPTYDNKPIFDDSNSPTNINNSIYRKNGSFIGDHNLKNQVNEDIKNIDIQHSDFENITNTINENYISCNNKIETIINESREVSNTLNDDLFIRMKVFEENKQNKTYFKRNIASEIGFITLDYFLTHSDVDKKIHDNDKPDRSKDQFFHGISSSSMNKENSLSKGRINSIGDVGSKRNNIDSNNISTNITENFRENMKRISELINNSYNKSIQEENQIITIQRKLHDLRSSNKPVNKDDIYSLIRRGESEQKIGSVDDIKKLNDKSESKEVIMENKKSNEGDDSKIIGISNERIEKSSITEVNKEIIEGNEPIKVELIHTINDENSLN